MAQPPGDHAFVKTTKPEAAAAARIGAGLAARKRDELLELLRPCFARVEPWLQAGKYAAALMSDLPRRNGWTLAEQAGDRTPDRMQRLLSRAVWDASAAMRAVRRFAVAGLDQAARSSGRRGLAVGAIDETSQVKQGVRTAGVKRHYLGCAGKVANGITTVHLAYARERTGHALIAARQWIPPSTSRTRPVADHGAAAGPGVPHQGAAGHRPAPRCSPTASSWTSPAGMRSTAAAPSCGSSWRHAARATCCASRRTSTSPWPAGSGSPARTRPPGCCQATAAGRSAPPERLQGPALVRLGLASHRLPAALPAHPPPPGHRRAGLPLLLRARRPAGVAVPADPRRRAAAGRWKRISGSGKGCFGLDESQVRLYTAIARHTVLVMAALAICAVTAALLRRRTDTRAPAPVRPDQPRPPTPA